ncbi:septum formation protein Maf [Leptospira biflexa]|uniref:Maf family protein n=1 Tax=Leptospira biflexa TaxID=172 RepID=UPI001091826D|nr:Maf family protein [Leptospira biflexa]TGM47048.1 septum formation protein Maf [Leptospira biflexa]TGM50486.1 septum formation protein Maf [Leptospira biflexa]
MFVLKSASPRRKHILSDLGFDLKIDPEHIDESQKELESPLEYLERMVHSKLGNLFEPNNVYLAADTIVVYQNQILHKPIDTKDAFRILKILSGKNHSVFSGAALRHPNGTEYFYEETTIGFQNWNDFEINEYIKRSKPFDKAGSYGIQDKDGPVLQWTGSYTNVMGFPLRSFLSRHELWIGSWEERIMRRD